MKQAVIEVINLNCLLENIVGLDAIQIEDRGQELYKELFLTTEYSGVHYTHDEQEITFSKIRFRHAFYLSPMKNEIDKRRVARIRWILPIISGQALNSECWLVDDNGIKKRLYICYGLNYVIWLEPQENKDKWIFSSAYVAEREQIREYTSRGTRIAEFNKKEKKDSKGKKGKKNKNRS